MYMSLRVKRSNLLCVSPAKLQRRWVIPAEAGIQKQKCYYRCMHKSIFRAYDIRGIYPTELNEQDAYKIAWAVFEYAKCKKVAVGHDARLSAPRIHQAVCRGFLDAGCEVTDCGMAGTDMMAWLAGAKDFDITINVTASHNPKEWIGMKIFERGGGSVGGDGEIQEIANIASNLNYQLLPITNGQLESTKDKDYCLSELKAYQTADFLRGWVQHILSFVDVSRIKSFKIVVDAGNGVAGPTVRELFQYLPVELVEMYFEPDGNFLNHLPSPIEPKNVADLRKRVVKEDADLGIAFDGDADRVFLIDEKGGIVTGSEMTAMVMDEILTVNPYHTVLYNAICGWNVRDVITKHNTTAHPTLTGIGFIKKDMVKHDAYFCGEHSGHYYFKENYNSDSGLIAVVFTLALLSKKDESLSKVLANHRRYVSIPETNFKVQNPQEVIEALAGKYQEGKVNRLDGLTVEFEDFWFNVRPSSNEPLLRLNVEAINKEVLQQKTKNLIEFIKSFSSVPTGV